MSERKRSTFESLSFNKSHNNANITSNLKCKQIGLRNLINVTVLLLLILQFNECLPGHTLYFSQFEPSPTIEIYEADNLFFIKHNLTFFYKAYVNTEVGYSYLDKWNMTVPDDAFFVNFYKRGIIKTAIVSAYFIDRYIICTTLAGQNVLFNEESALFVRELTSLGSGILNGYEVESAGKFFFSTEGGKFGYVNTSRLSANDAPFDIDSKISTPTYCYVSLDETLIANAFETDTFVKVYSTSNDSVVATLQTGSDDQNYLCVFTQTHLLIFPFDSPNIYMYKMSDWSLEQIFVSAHYKKRQGTYFALENTVVCIDEDTESAYAFDLNIMNEYDIDLGGVSVKKMSSDSPNYMAFTDITQPIAHIFQISSEEIEPEPLKCGENCEICENVTYCGECKVKYTENDGECVSNADVIGENGFNNNAFVTVSTDSFDSVGELNSLPASRRLLKPLFAFFSNFDHLWLYVYHKREYGYHMASLLESVLIIEQEKWEGLSSILPKSVNDKIEEAENKFIYIEEQEKSKDKERKSKFLSVEGINRSFIGANLDFFLMNVPVILVMFLVLKFTFNLLRNYRVSLYIRQFSFGAYLFLMLAEGNIQSFTYFFISDCLQLFSLSFKGKLLSALVSILFCFFLFLTLSFFFMVKHFYKKKTKYFTDNYKQTFKSLKFLIIEFVLINILLGFIHIVFEDYYNLQVFLLISAELIYAYVLVYIIRGKSLVEFKFFLILNLFTCLLRILLNITFLIDYSLIVKPSELNTISYIQGYIIYCYIGAWIMAFSYSIFCILKEFFFPIILIYYSKTANLEKINTNEQEEENLNKKAELVLHINKEFTLVERLSNFEIPTIQDNNITPKDNISLKNSENGKKIIKRQSRFSEFIKKKRRVPFIKLSYFSKEVNDDDIMAVRLDVDKEKYKLNKHVIKINK